MKNTKKLLSLFLAILMIFSCSSVAFAEQSFSGKYNEDITISKGATIADDAVFNGNVTIASGATVSNGTFNGPVTNNGTINGGTFKGAVTNNGAGNKFIVQISCGINGGTFDGTVTNSNGATIGGGTYNGSLTNNGELTASTENVAGPVANSTVTNNSKIISGSYYGAVNNNGTISGGSYFNVINNSATVNSTVSAIVKSGNAYAVQGAPTVKGKLSISGKDATFTCDSNKKLTIAEGAQLELNCPCTINGTIELSGGAKLTSNGGSLTSGSAGRINVPMSASFTGTTASKFEYITYKEHAIKVESNIDSNQFTFAVASSAYKDRNVSYAFDLSGSAAGCLVLNNVTVYKSKKNDSNIIKKANDKVSSFTMPDDDVIIYVDCTANHSAKSEHKDPACTTDGYDITYCDICNHQISKTIINKLGHQYGEWVRNTDPDSKMLKSRACTREGCDYCDKAYIEIKGYDVQEVTVDFKSTLTFNYNGSLSNVGVKPRK